MLETFRAIEATFRFPQDIEWCLQGERLYVLQSRPITTLQPAMLHLMQDVENDLPMGDFLFEKTEISEIAPHPDEETWALLQRIYKKGGPVQNAYAHYGLSYTPDPFLKRLVGELYVDREAELHSLFPAMSFFKKSRILEKPRFAQMKGLRQTLRNAMKLRSLPHDAYASYADALRQALYAKSLGDFFTDYELIFKINLLSASALARLKPYVRQNPKNPSLSALLQGGTTLFPGLVEQWEAPKHCVGNSLDLQDASPFQAHLNDGSNSNLLPWWNALRAWERKALEEPLKAALVFLRLREYARWLLVRHTNQLRPKARRKAASFREVLLPKRLASRPLENTSVLLGVSPGKALARLITLEQAKAGRKGILMTRLLSPDLFSNSPHLQGIVSEEGGLLSHLAIMAREKGLPVLVGVDLSTLKAGDLMHLDAENGCYEIEESA